MSLKYSALMLLSALLLGGCDSGGDPYVVACRTLLKETLKSPSSLQVVHEVQFVEESAITVTIEYDAANSFGAMLRGDLKCQFADPSSLEELPERYSRNTTLQEAMKAVRLVRKVTNDGELIGEQCEDFTKERCLGSHVALDTLRMAAMDSIKKQEK